MCIYIYTVYTNILEICREKEGGCYLYYHSISSGHFREMVFFCPQVSNESFITQALAPMVTASTQLISTVTVHSAFFQKADRYRDRQPQMVPNDSQALLSAKSRISTESCFIRSKKGQALISESITMYHQWYSTE